MHRVLALVLACCLIVAGCTETVTGTAVSPGGSSGAGPAAGGESKPAKRPRDRNQAAVLLALRQIDACALFDKSLSKKLSPDATPLASGPHSCELTEIRDGYPSSPLMQVAVGAGFDHVSRYGAAPVTIAGAKAYEYRDATSRTCEVTFPVSFTLGVQLEHEAGTPEKACPVVHRFGKAVVAKLRKPGSIRVQRAERPLSAWDGCTLLVHLLDKPKDYTYEVDGTKDPFSGCHGRLDQEVDPSSSAGESVSLDAEYNRELQSGSKTRTIAGKKVAVDDRGEDCVLSWVQGDSRTGNEWVGKLIIELTATCAKASKMAATAIRLAGKAPSKPGRPQRKLLYGPGDPDSAAPGACLHLAVGHNAECEPYQPTTAPKGYEAIVAAEANNRNVRCAVFAPAVTSKFGSTFKPVIYGEHCIFVDPKHELDITVNVLPNSEMYVLNKYADDPSLYTDRQEIQLAGKSALTFFSSGKDAFDIYLSPTNDLNAGGGLHIGLEASRPRGDRSGIEGPPVDPALVELAKQAMSEAVEAHLN